MMHHFAIFLLSFYFTASFAQTTSRTFSLINNCDKDIWLSFTSGASPYAAGRSSCMTDTDCIEGSACNTDNGICFWDVPLPSTGVYRLTNNGGNSTIQFPILNTDVVWSGNIKACVNGTCDASESECDKNGCGIAGPSPVTMVEFTLSKTSVDFYDLSIINGMNIPVEMSPIQPFTVDPNKPYDCGNPGGLTALTGYGACTWEFSPPSKEFLWVHEGNEDLISDCSSDLECKAAPISNRDTAVCGMSNKGVLTCGDHLGYWTLDQFCGQHLDQFYPKADCQMPLSDPNAGQTLWNLLGCVDVPSCYQPDSGNNCCGCVDWQNELDAVSPLTETCYNSNPNWLQYVKPSLQFMKEACPSAYTYPYDDHSSTYVCSHLDADGINDVQYSVTFCPLK